MDTHIYIFHLFFLNQNRFLLVCCWNEALGYRGESNRYMEAPFRSSEPMQLKPHMLRNRFISSSLNQTSGSIYRIEWKWAYLLMLQWTPYQRFNPTALAEFWNSELTVSQQWKEGSHTFYPQVTALIHRKPYEYTNKCITILVPFVMKTDSLLALWKFDYCFAKGVQAQTDQTNMQPYITCIV